jgi:5S rRNA maturation endonuclease (ribonuclease M5)
MTVRDAIVEKLDVHKVLTGLLGLDVTDKGNDWRTLCPFHDDEHPSLNVQKDEGTLYCFVCNHTGSLFDLVMELNDVRYKEAESLLADFLGVDPTGTTALAPPKKATVLRKTSDDRDDEAEAEAASRPPIDPVLVESWHNALWTTYHRQHGYLTTTLQLSENVIKQFKIGFDGERYTIPVKDETGTIVNVRRYNPDAPDSEDKMKNYYQVDPKTGIIAYGRPARLFPMEALGEGDEIILVEGEKDCLVARNNGFNAMTTTGGAAKWRKKWNDLFRGKRVYICYDMDKAGREGAAKIAKELESVTGVYIVELPAPSSAIKGYDLSDFFLKEHGSASDFRTILLDARTFSTPPVPVAGTPPIRNVPLGMASLASNMGQPLATKVVVSGKNMAPYIVPKKLRVTCACTDSEDACRFCPRWTRAGVSRAVHYDEEVEVNAANDKLLKLINCSDTQQKGYLKEIAGIDKKCEFGRVEIKDSGNLQQIIVIPELDAMAASLEEQEYVSRNAYYLGHDIIANRAYEMQGYTWPHPLNQTATHVFDFKDDMQDSIRSFEMTPTIYAELKELFRPATGESIDDKLRDIYNYHVLNTHGIKGRGEIQLAFDLVWHSILNFTFMGQPVRKGWLEGLIVGDTSQGKTELTTRMRDFYNLGQRITGEKTSAAGLIGGLQKVGEQWILQWGAYPQNDRRALLIDEYSSLSTNDIANMTDLRSTGVAEIVKIRTERTNARVRALHCSNQRSGLMLRDVMQGISAIKDLMGKNEDIRRLDFALTVATGEVSLDDINIPKEKLPKSKKIYNREASKNLILWAWSRNTLALSNQVLFESDAETAILNHARRMGDKYHPRIPLVEPSDQRLKIARLAAALAARLFSCDETGDTVVVTKEHVNYVVRWLESQYDKSSMSYDSWSEMAWASERFDPATEVLVADVITDMPSAGDIVLFFSKQNRSFRQAEFEAATGIDREDIKELIKILIRHSALQVDGNGYRTQPNLNTLIKKLKSGAVVGSRSVVMP